MQALSSSCTCMLIWMDADLASLAVIVALLRQCCKGAQSTVELASYLHKPQHVMLTT